VKEGSRVDIVLRKTRAGEYRGPFVGNLTFREGCENVAEFLAGLERRKGGCGVGYFNLYLSCDCTDIYIVLYQYDTGCGGSPRTPRSQVSQRGRRRLERK